MNATELRYNGSSAVILRYEDGQPALWVTDEYLAGRVDEYGHYSLNDINEGVEIGPEEELEPLIAAWKRAVQWSSHESNCR